MVKIVNTKKYTTQPVDAQLTFDVSSGGGGAAEQEIVGKLSNTDLIGYCGERKRKKVSVPQRCGHEDGQKDERFISFVKSRIYKENSFFTRMMMGSNARKENRVNDNGG